MAKAEITINVADVPVIKAAIADLRTQPADVLAERDRLRAVVQRVEGLAADFDDGSEWGAIEHRGWKVRRCILNALAEPAQMPQDGSGPSTDTRSAPAAAQGAVRGAGDGV